MGRVNYLYIVSCQWHPQPRIVHAGVPGKLIHAWTDTPTKWYPLPLAVGAILLVAIQYRKKVKRAQQEVEVNDDGLEVIKLKGPWHVSGVVYQFWASYSLPIA